MDLQYTYAICLKRPAKPDINKKKDISERMSQSNCSKDEREAEMVALEPGIGIPQIPFDLFMKKSRKGICFTDAFQNVIYRCSAPRLHDHGHTEPKPKRVLFDASGNPLISLVRSHDSSWKALKADASSEELLFRVEPTLNTFSKSTFNVILIGVGDGDLTLNMRGCCFWRSCAIYHDNSILAQTNLMYKLGFRKHFVSRSRFRVTIFPGFPHFNLLAALIVIFLEARK